MTVIWTGTFETESVRDLQNIGRNDVRAVAGCARAGAGAIGRRWGRLAGATGAGAAGPAAYLRFAGFLLDAAIPGIHLRSP